MGASCSRALPGRRAGGGAHVGAAGVLALGADVTRGAAAAWIAEAVEFAAEWTELRGVFQSRLFGVCVRSPLQARTLPYPTQHPSSWVPCI